MKNFCLTIALFISFTVEAANASPRLPATVTWIGNSYPGGDGKHVPQDIDALCVTPDGRVFSNTFWEEAGGNVTEFKDGKVIGNAGHTHGWGNTGGRAIACNSKYLFIGCRMQNEGGGLNDISTWPPKGKQWLGISRRPLSDIKRAAPFEGAKGGKGDTLKGAFLVVAEVDDNNKVEDLPGIAADEKRLYVSCPSDNTIKIYDAETMARVDEWKIERPGPIALAKDGTLWILQGIKGLQSMRLAHLSSDGPVIQEHYDFGPSDKPASITISSDGHPLVSDQSAVQYIRVFLLNNKKVVLPIGTRGGIFAVPAGKFGDLRFNNPSAVACDAAGNIYVASRGASGGGSTVLESYDAQNKIRWRLFGLNFVDMADVDPADDTQIFTKEERFSYDYAKSGAAAWNYAAYTLNPFRFPDDPRLKLWSAGAWIRRIGGQKFLFVNDMNAEWQQIYRFDGETAVPHAIFAQKHINKGNWPPNQPAKGEWIWRYNGGGAFGADEYDSRETDAPSSQGWWVDDNGGVWLATEKQGVRYFPCKIEKGTPSWSYATVQTFAHAAEFSEVKRVRYDVKTDTLYLGGTKGDDKNQHWKPMGPVIARYDGWLKGERKLRWQITAPYQKGSSGHESCEPMGFDIAGDYVFVPYTGAGKTLGFKTGHIEVFRASDGASVGHMEPGADIGEIGLQDIRECLRAHQRKDGEYIVFLEDDYKAKILLYRWKP